MWSLIKTAGVWKSLGEKSTSSKIKILVQVKISVCLGTGQTKATPFYLQQDAKKKKKKINPQHFIT